MPAFHFFQPATSRKKDQITSGEAEVSILCSFFHMARSFLPNLSASLRGDKRDLSPERAARAKTGTDRWGPGHFFSRPRAINPSTRFLAQRFLMAAAAHAAHVASLGTADMHSTKTSRRRNARSRNFSA